MESKQDIVMTSKDLSSKHSFFKFIAILAFLAVLPSCDKSNANLLNSKKVEFEQVDNFNYVLPVPNTTNVSIFHDNKRNVTCWVIVKGISCLPDRDITSPKVIK